MTPASKRAIVKKMKVDYDISERSSCELAGISRSSYYYRPVKGSDAKLRCRLQELASQYPSYGYISLHNLLKREGLVINKKRTYRLYVEEKLQVRKKKRRKKLCQPRQPVLTPTGVNQRWSMDFVSDQLGCGRRFRILNVIDDYSRELLGQLIHTSISGRQVARFLDKLIAERDRPDKIVCDNGPEFTSKAMFFWSQDSGVKLHFIEPGKPTQNAFVESLNGKFRENCLNLHWFRSLKEACHIIEQWRYHYNHERPHSSLNYLTPVAFASKVA